MQENKPILIVGLGNPGADYARTRHNAGFMAVDKLVGETVVWKKEKNALVAKIDGNFFAKPQTFMNLSGAAVQGIMAYYKIPLENLVVIHDDLDLPLGTVREKVGGGSAGHNGIKSIDAHIGNEYHRIRIGIGRPENPEIPVNDWVLGKFTATEKKQLDAVLDSIEINGL